MTKINPAEIIGKACGIQPKKGYEISEVESIPLTRNLPLPNFGHRKTIDTVLIQEDENGKPTGIELVRVYLKRS